MGGANQVDKPDIKVKGWWKVTEDELIICNILVWLKMASLTKDVNQLFGCIKNNFQHHRRHDRELTSFPRSDGQAGLPSDKKSVALKEDDDFRGPAEKFLDDKELAREVQANGPDDEDMADGQFEGDGAAPQVQKVPDAAANDVELNQQKRFRVSVFAASYYKINLSII